MIVWILWKKNYLKSMGFLKICIFDQFSEKQTSRNNMLCELASIFLTCLTTFKQYRSVHSISEILFEYCHFD